MCRWILYVILSVFKYLYCLFVIFLTVLTDKQGEFSYRYRFIPGKKVNNNLKETYAIKTTVCPDCGAVPGNFLLKHRF